jgi:aminoglycoside phosphotransferase (APT) family kinase protein
VHDAVAAGSRLTHGDLKSDQIFVTSDGYRVIDWQRPVVAPPDVDLVSVLVDSGIDPGEYVGAAVRRLFWFLRLQWAVVAQFDLFPGRRWPLFDRWAAEATGEILA